MKDSQLEIAFRSDANVLICGPTGSGKTRLAREIHEGGSRKGKPFAAINLATLHEGTIESELFGHERGAFTGAEQRRIGRLESANGGTVFLDEIGDLPPRLQARLLEFLQSKTISPVGSNRETRLDVRVIAATHRNLERAVRAGEFREDLFHRIRVVSFHLKSLSERWDEFDSILHSALEEICVSKGISILKISEQVAESLERYSWPGNFRELRNVLEYAVIAATGTEIEFKDLPPWFHLARRDLEIAGAGAGATSLGVREVELSLDYHSTLAGFEREYLRLALQRFRGKIGRTAAAIGMNKATLLRRIRAYGLLREASLEEIPPKEAVRAAPQERRELFA